MSHEHRQMGRGDNHSCMIWSLLSSLCTAQDHQRWLCSKRPTESCLAGRPAPIRIKDRQYYKKLLDRYFGHNHALANDNYGKPDKKNSRQMAQTHSRCANGYQGGMFCPTRDDRQFPHVRLSYSTSDRKVVLTHQAGPPDDSEAEELFDLEVGNCVPNVAELLYSVLFELLILIWIFFPVHLAVLFLYFVSWCDASS